MLASVAIAIAIYQDAIPNSVLNQRMSAIHVAETVPEIAQSLSKKLGIKINVPAVAQELKATVLVREQKFEDILNSLASVLDLKWIKQGDGIAFLPHPSLQQQLIQYSRSEDKYLFDRVSKALGALSSQLSSSTYPTSPSSSKLSDEVLRDPQQLKAWAQANVSQPEYRVLAHSYRAGLISNIQFGGWPNAYSIGKLNNPKSAEFKARAFESNDSPYNGSHLLIKFIHLTGDLQFVDVRTGKQGSLEENFPLVKYAMPPSSLSDLPFAKYVIAWGAKPLPASEKILDTRFSGKTSEEASTTLAMADHLKWIHDNSNVSIISDAFRIPSQSTKLLTDSKTPRAYLKSLQETDRLLVKSDEGLIEIKSGGYWRLRRSEPPETATRWLEAIAKERMPTIYEYADFVFTADFISFSRFEKPGRFVAKFDTRPLLTSRSPLFVLGALDTSSRRVIAAHNPVDVIATMRNRPGQIIPTPGRKAHNLQEDWLRFRPDPAGIAFAGADAMFQSGRPYGNATDFLEYTEGPGSFLASEKRFSSIDSHSQLCGRALQLRPDGSFAIIVSPQAGFTYQGLGAEVVGR